MKMSNFVEGLIILKEYFDEDRYVIGAEHDCFYVYTTDRAVSPEDLQKLHELGWFQNDEVETAGDEWEPSDYDPDGGWMVFT